ncbi:RidA family protein [Gordonia sp. X0973]|uniref:RidA family protein n=1 Tax=Gordonia sp. X0973 TaxID=2742602 RepID=UPI000F527936|nr:RidA family protein [Gordonia sp. X0973]QKT06421.1 RidA family protein [Gordonia sp. X0973]
MTTIDHLNPTELPSSPAFSQGTVTPAGRTLYVGGQNGTTRDGTLADGTAAQTAQALRNVRSVLGEAGAGPEHVAKLTIHLAEGADVREAFGATPEVWGPYPTAITVLRVVGFARPDALVEIDAVAALPPESA